MVSQHQQGIRKRKPGLAANDPQVHVSTYWTIAMKRRVFLKCSVLLGAAWAYGCSGNSSNTQDNGSLNPAVALVETRSTAVPSCIHWLDDSLVEIGQTEIDQAYLSGWNPPVAHNGLLHLAPVGLTGRNDAHSLVTVDASTGNARTYAVDTVNNYCVAAADNLSFIANNLNMESIVTRIDLADASTKSVSLGPFIADSVITVNDLLLVFSWDPSSDGEKSKISLFDLDLNLLSETPLEGFGSGIERPRALGDSVYFTPWTKATATPEDYGTVGIFNIAREVLETLDLNEEVVDAVPTSSGLVLVHGNIHASKDSTIDVELLEYESWEKQSETRLPFATYQSESAGNDLVILDASDNLHRIAVGGDWEEAATALVARKYSGSHFSSITLI